MSKSEDQQRSYKQKRFGALAPLQKCTHISNRDYRKIMCLIELIHFVLLLKRLALPFLNFGLNSERWGCKIPFFLFYLVMD